MPESRDRLVRPVDLAANFARRRSGALGVFQDEPDATARSPIGRENTARGGILWMINTSGGSPSATRGPIARQNTPLRRKGRSVLPARYPRTPLRDITSVVRAIERRRARLERPTDGEVEGQQMERPMAQDHQTEVDSSLSVLGARPKHDATLMSPNPSSSIKHCPPSIGKAPKILLNVTNKAGGKLESLTPEKKLLNSIDKVEKVVTEELKRLKRTPSAKKAEREKRVRTLMSMR